MNFLTRFSARLRDFMSGRYGMDKLNMGLIGTALVLSIINILFRSRIISLIETIIFLFFLFRMLSKNYQKRSIENDKFEKVWNPFWKKCVGLKKQYVDDKDFKYFKCPNCGIKVKVPKGKGKISIRCPKCRIDFIQKT